MCTSNSKINCKLQTNPLPTSGESCNYLGLNKKTRNALHDMEVRDNTKWTQMGSNNRDSRLVA